VDDVIAAHLRKAGAGPLIRDRLPSEPSPHQNMASAVKSINSMLQKHSKHDKALDLDAQLGQTSWSIHQQPLLPLSH
jgi:hypothetical protein